MMKALCILSFVLVANALSEDQIGEWRKINGNSFIPFLSGQSGPTSFYSITDGKLSLTLYDSCCQMKKSLKLTISLCSQLSIQRINKIIKLTNYPVLQEFIDETKQNEIKTEQFVQVNLNLTLNRRISLSLQSHEEKIQILFNQKLLKQYLANRMRLVMQVCCIIFFLYEFVCVRILESKNMKEIHSRIKITPPDIILLQTYILSLDCGSRLSWLLVICAGIQFSYKWTANKITENIVIMTLPIAWLLATLGILTLAQFPYLIIATHINQMTGFIRSINRWFSYHDTTILWIIASMLQYGCLFLILFLFSDEYPSLIQQVPLSSYTLSYQLYFLVGFINYFGGIKILYRRIKYYVMRWIGGIDPNQNGSDKVCFICFLYLGKLSLKEGSEEFEWEEQSIVKSICGHEFHERCFKEELNYSKKCHKDLSILKLQDKS